MFFYGFSAGLPLMLIFSSLSLWLREAGIERSVVTLFSWAALGYSFKFVWAPLVDSIPLPWLTQKLGRRRSWILMAQTGIVIAIVLMALQDPATGQASLVLMAVAAVMLGFSSATQDIVIDAYRIESAALRLQALMSSTYIAGYRIAMLVSGAGALLIASYFGTTPQHYSYDAWKYAYFIMASCMLIGIITTFLVPEPDRPKSDEPRRHRDMNHGQVLLLFVSSAVILIMMYRLSAGPSSVIKEVLAEILSSAAVAGAVAEFLRLSFGIAAAIVFGLGMIKFNVIESRDAKTLYIEPVRDFFARYGLALALFLLGLVGLYRISDIVLGVISNVFYLDMGFSKNEIAAVSKAFGLLMTLSGGFIGGILAIRFGVIKILLSGAILSAVTNLLFLILANVGYSMTWLYIVIGADNLSAGIATASFVAFLSALTNIKFTAMQYSIFTSLMTLIPKMLGGYSGSIVDALGYSRFFVITAVLGLPVILLILILARNERFK